MLRMSASCDTFVYPSFPSGVTPSSMYQATYSEDQDFKRRKLMSNSFDCSSLSSSSRRRVNPESLAQRLGPVLVRELNSLIYPGMTEMPSFVVRQEIQKRFNVNRRHIYDWFHSKGLRVTKESERRLVPESVSSPHFPRKILQRPVYEVPSSLPELSYSSSEQGSESSMSTPTRLLTPSDSISDLAEQEKQALLSMSRDEFLFNPSLADLHELSICSTPAGMACLGSASLPEAPAAAEEDPIATVHVKRLFNQLYELQQLQDLSTSTCVRPAPANEKLDALKPVDENTALTQSEREAFYNCLSDVLGPASGVQESVGSYKTYMEKQTEIYYERLLPKKPVEQSSTEEQGKENSSPSSSEAQHGSAANPVHCEARVASFRVPPSIRPLVASVQPQCTPLHALRVASLGTLPMGGGTGLGSQHSISGGALPQRVSVSDARMEADFAIWPSDSGNVVNSSNTSDSTDLAPLDLSDLLNSSVLRSRNPSCAPAPTNYISEDFCIPAEALPFYSALPYSFPALDAAGFSFPFHQPFVPQRIANFATANGRAVARSYLPMPPSYAVFGM